MMYEQLEVQEYWLFDPRGEWIKEKLQGYRLRGESYELIADSRSEPLQLRLAAEAKLIGFYREDTQEKLLIPDELIVALQEQIKARKEAEEKVKRAEEKAKQAEEKARQMEALIERYRENFGELPEQNLKSDLEEIHYAVRI